MQVSISSGTSNREEISLRKFECRIKVRWNEMDSNGHVNNMYYQSYFDQARIEVFEKVGLDMEEMRERGIGPVIYKTELDYKKELKHPDTAIITSSIEVFKKTRGIIHQIIHSGRSGEEVCVARFHGMFMNLKRMRPQVFPEQILLALREPG